MKHATRLASVDNSDEKSLFVKATGRFYTPRFVAERLARQLVHEPRWCSSEVVRVADPFCGDGRLLVALLREAASLGIGARHQWQVACWDLDQDAVMVAANAVRLAADSLGIDVEIDARCHDTLVEARHHYGEFDCVATNPPWDELKPDRRDLARMSPDERAAYREDLRAYDRQLAELLPLSQPARKFAGWGTNLSRCGTEAALRLLRPGGVCGIVVPSSLLSDQATLALRRWMLAEFSWSSIDHYPAEARMFEAVDQPFVVAIFRSASPEGFAPVVARFGPDLSVRSEEPLVLNDDDLALLNHSVPVEHGQAVVDAERRWRSLTFLRDLEGTGELDLWLGRELDETGIDAALGDHGRYQFLKGRMVRRFGLVEPPTRFVRDDLRRVPATADHARVAWRDVSRRSQARRMHVAVVPPGVVTGNSLHVGYFRDDDLARLRALAAVMNSVPFEFQVRSRLGTGHISLGVVKAVRVPDLTDSLLVERLSTAWIRAEAGVHGAEWEVEVEAARAYGLTRADLEALLEFFPTLPATDAHDLLSHPAWNEADGQAAEAPHRPASKDDATAELLEASPRIPNHYSAKLSELDMTMAVAVPSGGNWKDIPEDVPSARVRQIRAGYEAGTGSRSTYYGRLHPDAPAYTINTYFGRPGNGCHLHYDAAGGQHRVISQREAARLQSFPDSFVFHGSRASVAQQIGNAVPPLLAYQVALRLPVVGQFVDLFSGAGGLSLGFKWTGWEPVVANDIDPSFLRTYRAGIHDATVCGDIRDEAVFSAILDAVRSAREGNEHIPLWVLGGPPCQGFSTAGKRRSMDDARNHLFYRYREMLDALQPAGFVFENVTGLLNMEGGRVFEAVKRELRPAAATLDCWVLRTEQHGVPQRRTRVLLVGHGGSSEIDPPPKVTELRRAGTLFDVLPAAVSVRDALSDLPPLRNGEDGSALDYVHEPRTPYQELMRGFITPRRYLEITGAGSSRG